MSDPDALAWKNVTDVALKSLEEIETAFFLQVLARRAIRNALSAGTLNNDSLGVKNLPVHVKAYVLESTNEYCRVMCTKLIC